MAAGTSPAEPACAIGMEGALLVRHQNAAWDTWKKLPTPSGCSVVFPPPGAPGVDSSRVSGARGGFRVGEAKPVEGVWLLHSERGGCSLSDSFGAGWVRNGTSLVVFAGAIAHV